MHAAARTRVRRLVCLLVALVALAHSGCLLVAAGVVGGAALGYAYCKGKVCGAYSASFDDTWAAVHTSLSELAMPIASERREAARGELESTSRAGDKVHIHIDLMDGPAPGAPPLSRVCVRVGTFGDYGLSEQVLNQVGAHLVPAAMPPGAVVESTAPPPLLPSTPPLTVPGPATAEPPLSSTPPASR